MRNGASAQRQAEERHVGQVHGRLSGIKIGEQPDDGIKHTLVLRKLRESPALRDHIRDYESLEVGGENRNDEAILRLVRNLFGETSACLDPRSDV